MKYVFIDPGWSNLGIAVFDNVSRKIETYSISVPKKFIKQNPSSSEKTERLDWIMNEVAEFFYNYYNLYIEEYVVRHEPKSIKGANTLLVIGRLTSLINSCLITHQEWKKYHNDRIRSSKSLNVEYNVPTNEHARDALFMGLAIIWRDYL